MEAQRRERSWGVGGTQEERERRGEEWDREQETGCWNRVRSWRHAGDLSPQLLRGSGDPGTERGKAQEEAFGTQATAAVSR